MIRDSFGFHRPKAITVAAAVLADLGCNARPLTLRYSFIQMMKLWMAFPKYLVDLDGYFDPKATPYDGNHQHELFASELLAVCL